MCGATTIRPDRQPSSPSAMVDMPSGRTLGDRVSRSRWVTVPLWWCANVYRRRVPSLTHAVRGRLDRVQDELDQFTDRFTVIDQELGAAVGIGQVGEFRVNAQLMVERCEHLLQVDGAVFRAFTQTVR